MPVLLVKGMSGEDSESVMVEMMNMFFGSMSVEAKKEFMRQMMPRMLEKIAEGMSSEDKQELMNSMMQNMMSTMSVGTKRKDFRPSEFCPCCNICEEDFKKKYNIE